MPMQAQPCAALLVLFISFEPWSAARLSPEHFWTENSPSTPWKRCLIKGAGNSPYSPHLLLTGKKAANNKSNPTIFAVLLLINMLEGTYLGTHFIDKWDILQYGLWFDLGFKNSQNENRLLVWVLGGFFLFVFVVLFFFFLIIKRVFKIKNEY